LEVVVSVVLSDFLIIGGGIIGINIARELKRLFRDATVILVEKEAECGLHASGRNSGVLHAGFYYSPDSLKAKFTRLGNRYLTRYCESKNIPINKCGKLVVAKDSNDHAFLDELLKRGASNGIELQVVNEKEAKEIEPRVKTCERAIFSPTTATVDPISVVAAMKRDAVDEGVHVQCGVRYIKKQKSSVQTSSGVYEAGYVINAAGLYADKIARDFGFSEQYRILPFKGLYLYSDEPPGAIRTNVYPVPNLNNPFLGVHFTVTATGRVKIGPTAIPALWRENYEGIDNFQLAEFTEILVRSCGLMALSNFDFKRLALQEVIKYSRRRMVALASALMDGVRREDYLRWGRPGIRAQLVDIKERRLEMDFVIQGDHRSMHILNAVSPAFTCSYPFSQYVCQQIKASLNG
jgi:L-2-hydroxyglutarate oxidase LhgO